MRAELTDDAVAEETTGRERLSGPREGSVEKLRRRLSGDLDTIVLRALNKEPHRRYASVEQFAEDIRRHLVGLPVTARRDSWRYRAGKFAIRHKLAVTATALVLIAVLGGVAATVREARIAAANQRRAEKRFNDVRQLANSFLFEFHDAIEHLPGSTPARELVVKRALEYLDSLSQEAGTDASLRRELANAYEKVGSVQGSPYRDNLGNIQGALESFQKAVAIREQLVRSSPGDQDLRSELAREYGEIGDVMAGSGDLKAAMDNYRKGMDVLASEQHPNTKTRIRSEVLTVRYGTGLAESGDLENAAENYQRAIVVIDELLKEDPSDRESVRDKAVANVHLADSYMQMQRLPEALAASRAAYDLFQSLLEPTNAQSKRDLGVSRQRIADILERMGDKRGALALYQSNLATDSALQQADPKNALFRRDVYIDIYKIARIQSMLGQTREALANQRKSVALNEAEAAANPGNPGPEQDLQTHYLRLGKILVQAKQKNEALHYFEKSQSIGESLSKTNPKDSEIRADLAEAEMNRSDVQLALGNPIAALAGYRDALSTAESILATNPANAEWKILLAQVSQKLGEYEAVQATKTLSPAKSASSRDEALRWLGKSLEIWKELQQRSALGSEYADKPAEVARELTQCAAIGHD